MRSVALVTAMIALVFGGVVLISTALEGRPEPMDGMDGMQQGAPNAPPVKGFAEGEEIRFIHTEASDGKVADMLTNMMGSPVLVVPALAQAPDAMVATVYVFTNGVRGEGPMGFQPDVFDRTPAMQGYSPLRRVHLVTWKDEGNARVLRSAGDIVSAERAGEVRVERTPAVVNMPMLTWPGGRR